MQLVETASRYAALESLPDPDQALHFFERFQHEAPRAFEAASRSPETLRRFVTLFSSSAFLAEAVIRHPGWLLGNTAVDPQEFAAFRKRELTGIVLRDMQGIASLAQTTGALSDLADAILNAAWKTVCAQLQPPSPRTRLSIISLGKLGGQELNYSSDIDLMFVSSGEDHGWCSRAAAALTELLSAYTPEGVCYRVDLRLRPDGRYGEICQSLAGAKRYYGQRARDWELQMLIKARVSAGDPEPGAELLSFVEPLIYTGDPSSLAFAERSRDQPATGLDIKFAPGGIRDIEFLVQHLQRRHGGADPFLRHGGTQTALARLREHALLSETEYARLNEAYVFLRHLEHRLQFQDDRQTHTLPSDPRAIGILARKMPATPNTPEPTVATLRQRLEELLSGVREISARMVAAHRPVPVPAAPAKPDPCAAFPAHCLERFEHHPDLRQCVLDLMENSRFLRDLLTRHPELLDEVEQACPSAQARDTAAPPNDARGLRRFFRERMVRIQTESVCRRAPIFKTLKRTSNLADAVIAGAYRLATGDPGNDGMMVIALGRLGMREFDLASDADLVFVLPDSEAPRREYWTTVAERIIQTVGSYSGDGVLFSIDTRLRPNGREGALVQTESAFKAYFAHHAEAWEGISYMKARGVAGNAARATGFLHDLQIVDWRRYGQNGRSRRELAEMRLRIEKEQGARNTLKAGFGGYYDIDFALLYYRLKGAGMFYKTLNTPERIDVVERMGHLEREDAGFLREAATFYRAVDHGLRIATGHAESHLPTAAEPLARLTELVSRWDRPRAVPLPHRLRAIQLRTRAFFDRVFG